MAIFRLVLKNVRRRGWYFKVTVMILGITSLCLLASLGALRGIQDRIRFAEDTDLFRAGYFHLSGLRNLATGDTLSYLERNNVGDDLAKLLSEQKSVLGIAKVINGNVAVAAEASSFTARASYVNSEAIQLLKPRGLKGAWLSDVD